MHIKSVKGFITRERWILGKTPAEMEKLLGFDSGRMSNGTKVYALRVLPENYQFAFAGHTHWSDGKPAGGKMPNLWPEKQVKIDERFMTNPVDRAKNYVRSSWALSGPERLIKVEPNNPHIPEESLYPPGAGVEQWKLLVELPAVLVKELELNERYFPK